MTVEDIHVLINQLSPEEKARLIGIVAQDLAKETKAPQPRRSLRGIWANWGKGISAEEIDEARREMWGEYVEGGR